MGSRAFPSRSCATLSITAAAALAGCASGPEPLPDLQHSKIAVSGESRNIYGASYFVPGNQVFVGGSTIGIQVGSSAGVLGLSAGALVDFRRNRAQVESREDTIALRFDADVAASLRAAGVPASTGDERTADVVVLPSATLSPLPRGVVLGCSLDVEFGERGRHNTLVRKRRYAYAAPVLRPFTGTGEGWTDAGGAVLRDATTTCFGLLARALAADWQGRFDASGRRVRWVRPDMEAARDAVELYATGEFVALDAAPANASRRALTIVVEPAVVLP